MELINIVSTYIPRKNTQTVIIAELKPHVFHILYAFMDTKMDIFYGQQFLFVFHSLFINKIIC